MTGPRTVRVSAASAEYDVVVGSGLVASIGERTKLALPQAARVLLATDAGLPADLIDTADRSLREAGLKVTAHMLRATERDKSLSQLETTLSAAVGARLERTDPVVALGGGIVGDLAGFAAAVYRRGCPVVQVPTTLLSMVDASVGGKTAANLSSGERLVKNMAGSFHQPSLVLADVGALVSLPDRVFTSGLAECIKHGMLAATASIGAPDPDLLSWTEANAAAIASRDTAILTELVARNITVKAAVVAQDERELDRRGGRALLNLGHTFGHAVEPVPGAAPSTGAEAPLQHGEAVAIGLLAACAAGARMGLTPDGYGDRIASLLSSIGLPTGATGLPDHATIADAMRDDKKVTSGALRLILPDGIGSCTVVESPGTGIVEAGIDVMTRRESP
ncbi:MAG: 3-dehydroquinate synthase family protein [Planctomycetota bacterium]